MKERPIIFSGEMVRAILARRKTQTRRVIKKPEQWQIEFNGERHIAEDVYGEQYDILDVCPYGQPGDRLWVRETFALLSKDATKELNPSKTDDGELWYRADPDCMSAYECSREDDRWKWRPSIHMPRWASRITLEVVSVRCERLQDISNDDAYAEGLENDDGDCLDHFMGYKRRVFEQGWNEINEKRGFGWDVNPWVWVVEFEKVIGE